jgi:hypothetical protein
MVGFGLRLSMRCLHLWGMLSNLQYATYELLPLIYNDREAWVLSGDQQMARNPSCRGQ